MQLSLNVNVNMFKASNSLRNLFGVASVLLSLSREDIMCDDVEIQINLINIDDEDIACPVGMY